jgi:molecular chaperone GrpE
MTKKNGKQTSKDEVTERADLEFLLAEKQEEVASCIDRLKHLQAEFENYKKRAAREIGAQEERSADRVILDFLPLYDNLQRAFASLSDTGDRDAFIEGVRQIAAQFEQIMKQKGVSPIDAVGRPFDPEYHEALLSVESDEDCNTVLEEFERGYLRSGRVLRPCKVKVSKGAPEMKEEET